MKCPVDNETLVMAERSGVEIDYCPKCRGVWLDRGELDKIIDRSAPSKQASTGYGDAPPTRQREKDYGQETYKKQKFSKKKKPESFLSELFDF